MVHNDKVKSLQHGQMVENAHRKTTNIDEDDAPHPIPSPTSPLPLARMGQMKLARHCYVTTMWKQNLFIGLTATHSLEKRKKQRGASLPLERARQEEPGGGRGGCRGVLSGACRTSVLCSTRRILQAGSDSQHGCPHHITRTGLHRAYLAPLGSFSPSGRQKSWLYALQRTDSELEVSIILVHCRRTEECTVDPRQSQ